MKPIKLATKSFETQGFRLLNKLFLLGKRIFSMRDIGEAAQLEKIPNNQLNKILHNLTKQKRLLRLRRGLYVSTGFLPGQTNTHPFVISTHLVQPSVISHWSALQYHGFTEQLPQTVTASTPKKVVTPSMREKSLSNRKTKHSWKINGVRYEYISVKPQHFFGIEKIWLDEYCQASITDKERTLIDLFAYPKIFGGIGEALGILQNSLGDIEIEKLVKYTIQYDKKSLAKRLGWALEHFGVQENKLLPLLKIPINYFCPLDPSSPPAGKCEKRWMIQNNLYKRTYK